MLLVSRSQGARASFELCAEGENPHEYGNTASFWVGGMLHCGDGCARLARGNWGGQLWRFKYFGRFRPSA